MQCIVLYFLVFAISCQYYNGKLTVAQQEIDTIKKETDTIEYVQLKSEPPATKVPNAGSINTGSTQPEELISFAKSLVGTHYRYGSADPVNGFDCSGFITFVFNHFNISVPRSSIDFTDYQKRVELKNAKPGDLILFTGTDSTVREVGHMGIITSENNGQFQFIHSSSGKANGVTITPLNDYYAGRFVKVIRVFRQ